MGDENADIRVDKFDLDSRLVMMNSFFQVVFTLNQIKSHHIYLFQ